MLESHLRSLDPSRLPLAGQLVVQVSDLSLQQLDHLLVVLLGTAGLPLPCLCLGHLQATFQTDVLLHSQACFLERTT